MCKNLIATLWNLFEDGQEKIKVERQLRKSKECDGKAQSCIQRICYVSKLMI